jgi:hypothetical protein
MTTHPWCVSTRTLDQAIGLLNQFISDRLRALESDYVLLLDSNPDLSADDIAALVAEERKRGVKWARDVERDLRAQVAREFN